VEIAGVTRILVTQLLDHRYSRQTPATSVSIITVFVLELPVHCMAHCR